MLIGGNLRQRQGPTQPRISAGAKRRRSSRNQRQLQRLCAVERNEIDGRLTCGGSGTSAVWLLLPTATTASGIFTIAELGGRHASVHSLRPTTSISVRTTTTRPRKRSTLANVFAHYDALPNVRAYAEVRLLADVNDFAGRAGRRVLQQAIPAEQRQPAAVAELQGRDGHHGGARRGPSTSAAAMSRVVAAQEITLSDWRYVLGAKGDLFNSTWNWNGWWQSARTRSRISTATTSPSTKSPKRLDVVTDPATGQPACASAVAGTDTACVPWDIFHTNGVTPAALDLPPTRRDFRTASPRKAWSVSSSIPTWVRPTTGVRPGPRTARPSRVGYRAARRETHLPGRRRAGVGDLSGFGGASPAIIGQYTVKEYYFGGSPADHGAAGLGLPAERQRRLSLLGLHHRRPHANSYLVSAWNGPRSGD